MAVDPATIKGMDASDEELFMVLMATDGKLLKAWVTILSRSETPQKRVTCADLLAYDNCFAQAPEIFGTDYRVTILSNLMRDKVAEVQAAAIQACYSITAKEAEVMLPKLKQVSERKNEKKAVHEAALEAVKYLNKQVNSRTRQ